MLWSKQVACQIDGDTAGTAAAARISSNPPSETKSRRQSVLALRTAGQGPATTVPLHLFHVRDPLCVRCRVVPAPCVLVIWHTQTNLQTWLRQNRERGAC
jgi:hypothetical protein